MIQGIIINIEWNLPGELEMAEIVMRLGGGENLRVEKVRLRLFGDELRNG